MNLIDRAKNMLLTPKTEWVVVAGEEPDPMKVFMSYVVPWILIDAICAFIGHGLIWGTGHYGVYAMKYGTHFGLISLIGSALSVWLSAAIVNALAPSFGSEKNMGRAMQTVAYSSTASYVGGILTLLPGIGWLGSLFWFYGVYLSYLGLPHTMKTPSDKVVSYMIVTIIVMVVVYLAIAAILGMIFLSIFGLGMLAGSHMGM